MADTQPDKHAREPEDALTVLKNVRDTINAPNNGIHDTVWYHPFETLVDYIDAARDRLSAISAQSPVGMEGLAGRLAELSAKATQGKWGKSRLSTGETQLVVSGNGPLRVFGYTFSDGDAEFIAALVTAYRSGALALHAPSQEGDDVDPVAGFYAAYAASFAPQPPSGAPDAPARRCLCDFPITDGRRPTHCHLCGQPKRAAIAQAEAGTSGTSEDRIERLIRESKEWRDMYVAAADERDRLIIALAQLQGSGPSERGA